MDAIQVVAATDDGYACQLAVMLLSLFERGGAPSIQVHALVPYDFKSASRILEALGNHGSKVTFRRVDVSVVADLKGRPDISNATYYRLMMGDLIPQSINRVIYMDCDMLVCGNMWELWQQPLGAALVAAVIDPGFKNHVLLGLPKPARYFNAGLLLVDLKRWREEKIGQKALEFAAANPARLTFNDQCALNWVLKDRWIELPIKWNVQTGFIGRTVNEHFFYPRGLREYLRGARIIHFNAPGRPWLYMDEHPFKSEYHALKARTPWSSQTCPDRYPHNIVIKHLRRWAPVLLPVYLYIRKYI